MQGLGGRAAGAAGCVRGNGAGSAALCVRRQRRLRGGRVGGWGHAGGEGSVDRSVAWRCTATPQDAGCSPARNCFYCPSRDALYPRSCCAAVGAPPRFGSGARFCQLGATWTNGDVGEAVQDLQRASRAMSRLAHARAEDQKEPLGGDARPCFLRGRRLARLPCRAFPAAPVRALVPMHAWAEGTPPAAPFVHPTLPFVAAPPCLQCRPSCPCPCVGRGPRGIMGSRSLPAHWPVALSRCPCCVVQSRPSCPCACGQRT